MGTHFLLYIHIPIILSGFTDTFKYNLTLCFSFCGSLPFFLRPHTSFPVDYEQPNAEDFHGLYAVNAAGQYLVMFFLCMLCV